MYRELSGKRRGGAAGVMSFKGHAPSGLRAARKGSGGGNAGRSLTRFSVILAVFLLPLFAGCVGVALKFSPSLVSHLRQTLFEECDPDLARNAIPANLKLMEGLLKSDPDNTDLLVTLSMGFSGYSLLFVEEGDPERASLLYRRAVDYGIRALGKKGGFLKVGGYSPQDLETLLKGVNREDLEPLFWTTLALNAWINLNLDRPSALAQLDLAQACLKRVMEIDGSYLYGLPLVLAGTSLSARPVIFGGRTDQAESLFERALGLSARAFFPSHYYYARYYAVGIQDRDLFLKLLNEIIDGNPAALGDMCLINTAIQERARRLLDRVDELFL